MKSAYFRITHNGDFHNDAVRFARRHPTVVFVGMVFGMGKFGKLST